MGKQCAHKIRTMKKCSGLMRYFYFNFDFPSSGLITKFGLIILKNSFCRLCNKIQVAPLDLAKKITLFHRFYSYFWYINYRDYPCILVRQPISSAVCRTTGMSKNWGPTSSTFHYFDNPVVRQFSKNWVVDHLDQSLWDPICANAQLFDKIRTSGMSN